MFEALAKLPEDPILGLAVAYNNDENPSKIDWEPEYTKMIMGIHRYSMRSSVPKP